MTKAWCQSKPTPAWCQPITTGVATNTGTAVLANRVEATGRGSLCTQGGEPPPPPSHRAAGRWPPTYHVHGGAAERGRHHVALEVPGKAEVGCGRRGRKQGGPGTHGPAAQHRTAQRPAARAAPILTRMLLGLARRPLGLDSRMFCGFRSRWMMPLLCSSRMAPAICCRKSRMVSSLSVRMAVGRRRSGAASLLGRGPRGPSLLGGPPARRHSHRRHVLLCTPGCPGPPICGPIWHLPPHTPPAQLRPAQHHLPAWQPLLLPSTPCPLLSFITSQQQLKARPAIGGPALSSGPGPQTVEG